MVRSEKHGSLEPSKRSAVSPFLVMEMMRAAAAREAAGYEVLHLEVGQPSTGAPRAALDAVANAIEHDPLGYTAALGMPELRSRVSQWYDERYDLDVPADRIAITTGASGSCVLAFLALFDVGDRVGVLSPGYPCYRNDLEAFGVEVITIPVGFDTGFRPTVAQLVAAGPLDGLVLASPSNPTGTVLFDDDLALLTSWARQNAVTLVVDEIYHGITFEQPAPSVLSHDSDVVVFNSFSKYFSMTGWRLGWLVVPPQLIGAIERLAQNLTIAAPAVSQIAGLAAFDATDELDANVVRYTENRRVLLDGLADAGFDRIAPADGAFYVWVDISHTGLTATALASIWLEKLGIAATPGLDFDRERGDDFIRFSYAGSTADMTEAMRRLSAP